MLQDLSQVFETAREVPRKIRQYLIVMDVFQSVADHTNSHVDQIGRGHLEHLLGELLTVLVDFLSANTNKLLTNMTKYQQTHLVAGDTND